MFSTKECAVLSWSRNGDTQGVILELSGQAICLKTATQLKYADGKPLSRSIQHIYSQLDSSRDTQVILTGHINRGVYLEFRVPKISDAELLSLLGFELANRLPFAIDELVWSYEVISKNTHDSANVLVRVYAVPKSDWEGILSELKLSGIKADMFLPTFMSEFGDNLCYLPSINSEFAFAQSNQSGIHSFIISSDDVIKQFDVLKDVDSQRLLVKFSEDEFRPGIMCGVHVLKRLGKIHHSLMNLPYDMLPKRLRTVRALLLILLFLTTLLVSSFAARVYRGNSALMWALHDEISFVQRRIEKLTTKKQLEDTIGMKIVTIKNQAFAGPDLLDNLISLTDALPNEMRLSHFTLRDNNIDLTIVSSLYSDTAINNLKLDPHFEVEGVRKTTKRGVSTVNVKLSIRGTIL